MDAYEGLVSFDGSGTVIPGAAESRDISADGLTYTFHLRDGLKWSNGDALVAQDFVNGMLRRMNPDTASDKGYYFSSVIKIKGAAGFIDPAKVVSNGACVIKEVVPQSHVLLARKPNYWDAAKVMIPFVKYHVTEDVNPELKRYQAGEIDITYDIPLNQIADLKVSLPGEVLVGKIVKGEAIPVHAYAGGVDPACKGPQIAEATLSQAEREAVAKELYAKAGYGPDNPLKINIVATVSEDSTRRAQGVALMWKKLLGVEAELQPMERKAWLDAFHAGTWDVFADNLVGDFAGPETFLAYMRPSAEPGYNWVKPEYDAAMDVAAALAEPAKRHAAMDVAEKILLDDYIFAPIAIVPVRHLVKPSVQGWAGSAAGYDNAQLLTLD